MRSITIFCSIFTLAVILLQQHVKGEGILVVARSRSLRWLDLAVPGDQGMLISVTGLNNVRAVTFHLGSVRVYWSDVGTRTISRAALDGSDQEILVSGVVAHGLVLDDADGQIYWTDYEKKEIGGMSLDGSGRRTVVFGGLDKPRAIALDSAGQNRMLYWTDVGANEKIERSFVNGTGRTTLVSVGLSLPYGLVVDSPNDVMYWAAAGNSIIEAASLDGSNRRHVADAPGPFSLTMFGDFLYLADQQENAVNRIKKSTGADSTTLLSFIADVNGIKTTSLPGDNDVAFVAGTTEIREYRLGSGEDLGTVIPLQGLESVYSVDYDPVEGYLYWADVNIMQIARARRDGSDQETLVSSSVGSLESIAVGVSTRRMYWVDSDLDVIECCSLNGTNRVELINLGLDRPRAIALDENNSKMYWTDWGAEAKIERASLNGTNREVLVNSRLAWPNGLALDLVTGTMYWIDAQLEQIEMAKLDGSGRMVVVSSRNLQAYGLSVLGEYLYWTDWRSKTALRAKVGSPNDVEVVVDASSPFTSVAVVSEIPQLPTRSSTTTTSTSTPTSTTSTTASTTPVSVQPQVTSVSPGYGPIAGGTVVVITGHNFPLSSAYVKLGSTLSINATIRSETMVTVTTPPVSDSYIDQPTSVALQFDSMSSLATPFKFVYKPNPSIMSVEPLVTIREGGITLTVNGTDLNSVANPEMNMTVVTGSSDENGEQQRIPYLLPCDVQTAVQMYCITPELELQDDDQQLTIYIGIILDGIPDYRNLSHNPELQQYGIVSVTSSPKFPADQDFEYSGNPISIQGQNMKTCCATHEFQVYVGVTQCDNLHIIDDGLSCEPPREPPTHIVGRERDDSYRIQVHVGENLQFKVGTLKYNRTRKWLTPVIAVVVLVVVAAIVALALVLFRRRLVRYNRAKKPDEVKLEDPAGDDGRIVFPNVRMSNLEGFEESKKSKDVRNVKKATNGGAIGSNGDGREPKGTVAYEDIRSVNGVLNTVVDIGGEISSAHTYASLGAERGKDGECATPHQWQPTTARNDTAQYEPVFQGQKPALAQYSTLQSVYGYELAGQDVLPEPVGDNDHNYINLPRKNAGN